MPELPVEMLRMGGLPALAGAEAHPHGAPGGKERRQRSHIGGRRAAAAEARGDARVARLVGEAGRSRRVELGRDQIERLVPRYSHEARILRATLLRVGPLHRIEDAVRMIGLLHETIGFDAALAASRMNFGGIEIRRDLGGDTILDAHLEQVGTRHALIAIGGDRAFLVWPIAGRLHAHPPRVAARLAAFAFKRSRVLPTSTTNRVWVPPQIGSSSSLAGTSKGTLRFLPANTAAAV